MLEKIKTFDLGEVWISPPKIIKSYRTPNKYNISKTNFFARPTRY